MLLDDDIPYLESIVPAGAAGFEQRLAAIEGALGRLGLGPGSRIADRVRRIEQALAAQEADHRREIGQESAARHEQFAKLAMKFSRRMDQLHLAVDAGDTKSPALSAAEIAVLVEQCIDEAIGRLSREAAELRSEIGSLAASLDALARSRGHE